MNIAALKLSNTFRTPGILLLAAVSVLLLMTADANAVFVVGTDGSIEHEVNSVTEFEVTGDDMSGMAVTVFYTNNTSESAIWAGTGGSSGSAIGSNFSLSIDGNTFGDNWLLFNTHPVGSDIGISGFRINAEVGGVVFDKIASPDLTTGSEPGSEFLPDVFNNALYTGAATYSHEISLSGPPENGDHQGDLYGILDVSISSGTLTDYIPPALGLLGVFTFNADTDLISQAVPEASQIIALSLVGLGSAFVVRRRRKKQNLMAA